MEVLEKKVFFFKIIFVDFFMIIVEENDLVWMLYGNGRVFIK